MDINIESGLTRMLIEVMVLSSRQFFLLLVIIPRLRPGLLSLRSVLSSRQLSFCARSPSALSLCSKSITDNADATDLFFSRIFLFWICMRLSGRWDLHGFTLVCGLSADFSCYMQSSAVQAQIQSEGNPRPSKSKNKKKSVKKIKSVASELSVSYFERVRTEPKAKEQSTNS